MLKVLAWLLGTVVGLVLLVVIALQFKPVQQFAAQKAASYLSDMLKTEVKIGGFTTDWRNAVVLKDLYIDDQQQDTLWYSGRLGLDMNVLALLKGKADISRIHLQNATLNLHIRPDSSSTFAFLLDAFAADGELRAVRVAEDDRAAAAEREADLGDADQRLAFDVEPVVDAEPDARRAVVEADVVLAAILFVRDERRAADHAGAEAELGHGAEEAIRVAAFDAVVLVPDTATFDLAAGKRDVAAARTEADEVAAGMDDGATSPETGEHRGLARSRIRSPSSMRPKMRAGREDRDAFAGGRLDLDRVREDR